MLTDLNSSVTFEGMANRFLKILVLATAPFLIAASDDASSAAESAPETGTAQPSLQATLEGLIEGEQHAAAVERCRRQEGESLGLTPVEARLCAQANLALGDRLHLIGLKTKARGFWLKASKLDLSLLDQADFLARLRPSEPPAAPAQPPVTTASPQVTAPTPLASGRGAPAETTATKTSEPETSPVLGPRGARRLHLGLGAGFDGLGSVHVGWCHAERVILETSVGWVFPVIDTRLRVLGFKRALTPFVGFGVTTPLSRQDTLGADLPSYEALMELGQSVHVDLGLAWLFHERIEAFAGVAFVTTLDSTDPNQIVFFPQAAGQLSFKL